MKRTGMGWALALIALPTLASAHGLKKDCDLEPACLGCWVWSCKEVEETVFDVEYKEVKKTVRVPYIKEIKEPVSCKVCKPFDSTGLRTCPEINYGRTVDEIVEKTCRIEKDECGNCHTVEEVTPKIKTCITRNEVTREIPVLEWQLIATEQKFNKIYYVRDWKDEEVVLRVPVKTPRTITRKVWTRVPTSTCGCDPNCSTCAESPAKEADPVQPIPTPDPPAPGSP